MKNRWEQVDLSRIIDLQRISREEFQKVKWWGCGSVIWENGYSVSNKRLLQLSEEISLGAVSR